MDKEMMKDGGFKSRKMIMVYVTIVLITAGFLAIGRWNALNVSYSTFCSSLLAAAAVYTVGNGAVKLIGSKAKADPSPPADPPTK